MLSDLSDSASAEIRAEMARQRVTTRSLAAQLNVHEVWLARRLNGKQQMTIDELGRICALLGIPLSSVLAEN